MCETTQNQSCFCLLPRQCIVYCPVCSVSILIIVSLHKLLQFCPLFYRFYVSRKIRSFSKLSFTNCNFHRKTSEKLSLNTLNKTFQCSPVCNNNCSNLYRYFSFIKHENKRNTLASQNGTMQRQRKVLRFTASPALLTIYFVLHHTQ